MSATYATSHGNARSLTHWGRPGIEPASSWILVGFVTHRATMGAPEESFLNVSVLLRTQHKLPAHSKQKPKFWRHPQEHHSNAIFPPSPGGHLDPSRPLHSHLLLCSVSRRNTLFTIYLLLFGFLRSPLDASFPTWGFLSDLFAATASVPRMQPSIRLVLNIYWLDSIFPSGFLSPFE